MINFTKMISAETEIFQGMFFYTMINWTPIQFYVLDYQYCIGSMQ